MRLTGRDRSWRTFIRVPSLGLLLTLLAANIQVQAQTAASDFTLSAFILALRIPVNLVNPDGTPTTTGNVFWLESDTSIPYSLCTSGTGWSFGNGGALGAVYHCSPYWIILPGETHFQALNLSIPADRTTRVSFTAMLEGKPLGSAGSVTRWTLKWDGTVEEALATGEKMKAIARP